MIHFIFRKSFWAQIFKVNQSECAESRYDVFLCNKDMKKISSFFLLTFVLLIPVIGMGKKVKPRKVLFVLTSHDKLGNSNQKTGYYLSEVSHPWSILVDADIEVDFVSPKGGLPPVDGFDLTDSLNRRFWENKYYQDKLLKTLSPQEVDSDEYIAIHYAGGHGTMWDFPDNQELADIAAKIYEKGGAISAVCHGPAGLINIRLSDGTYLLQDLKVCSFTNEEEKLVDLDEVVPFLLESQMRKRGAFFKHGKPWQEFAVEDKRVITGQNPQSALKVGRLLLNAINEISQE